MLRPENFRMGYILNPDRLINLEIIQEENKHYLIWRLRKRGDQSLISISAIQFSAQIR